MPPFALRLSFVPFVHLANLFSAPNDILRAMTDKEFASKSGASDGPGSRIVPSGYGPSVRGRGATMSTRGRGSVPSPVNNYAPGPIQQQMMQQVPQQQQQSFFDSRISQIPPPQPVSVQQMTQQVPQQASPQFFPPPPASSAPATSAIPQPTLIPTPMAVEPSEPVEEKDDKEKTSGATLPCIVNTFGFGSGHQAELLKVLSCVSHVCLFLENLRKGKWIISGYRNQGHDS